MPPKNPLLGSDKTGLILKLIKAIEEYRQGIDDGNFTEALIEKFEEYRETFDKEDEFQKYLDRIIKQAFYKEDIDLIQYFLNKRTGLSKISEILTKRHQVFFGQGDYMLSSSDLLGIISKLERNPQRDKLIKRVIKHRNRYLTTDEKYDLIKLYTDAQWEILQGKDKDFFENIIKHSDSKELIDFCLDNVKDTAERMQVITRFDLKNEWSEQLSTNISHLITRLSVNELQAFVQVHHFELLENYMWQADIDQRVYRAFEVYARAVEIIIKN